MKFGKIKQLTMTPSNLKRLINRLSEKYQVDSLPEQELIIKKVGNSFLLKVSDGNGYTYEVIECEGNEKETLTRMLTSVAEFFGIVYNKHKTDNLNITFDKKGYKRE